MSFRRPAGSIRRPRARSEKREPRPDRKGTWPGFQDGVRWAPVAPSWRINPGTPARVPSKENPGQRQADRGQRRRGPRDGGERAPPRRFNSKTPALVPSKENPGQTPSRTGVIAWQKSSPRLPVNINNWGVLGGRLDCRHIPLWIDYGPPGACAVGIRETGVAIDPPTLTPVLAAPTSRSGEREPKRNANPSRSPQPPCVGAD